MSPLPFRLAQVCAALLLAACASTLPAADIERTGGPYVPTPQAVVDAMLDLAKVNRDDYVVDLGSGDGRIVLTAALRYGARGMGVDIDPELVQSSNAEAKKRGIDDRIKFIQEDVLKAHVDEATVLTLYLLPGMMQSLQSKLLRELKPGTRIVSHDFPFGEWKAEREVSIDIPEKYGTPGQWKSTLFYWIVPAHIQGSWQISGPSLTPQSLLLSLNQQFQYIEGGANTGGKRVPISAGKVEGDRIQFKLTLPKGAYEFRGVIEGDRMHGDAVQGERTIPWTAVKTSAAVLQ